MFKPLWKHGRAIIPADGWFEWKREGDKKQPWFICHKESRPLFFAAIGKAPFNNDHGHEGFVILTKSSNQSLVDIHDRRPLVLPTQVVREWLSSDTSPERADEIASHGALPEAAFVGYPVSRAVGNIRNQGADLISRIDDPDV